MNLTDETTKLEKNESLPLTTMDLNLTEDMAINMTSNSSKMSQIQPKMEEHKT